MSCVLTEGMDILDALLSTENVEKKRKDFLCVVQTFFFFLHKTKR